MSMIPKLVHYKQTILDRVKLDPDPNDRHIREWTDTHVKPKRLLRDMEREGYIKVTYEMHGKTCKRMIHRLVNNIIE
jgi:hypothetical protein